MKLEELSFVLMLSALALKIEGWVMFSRFIDYSLLAPIVLIFWYMLFGICAWVVFPIEKRLGVPVGRISIGFIRLDNNV